jgi:hypothetical protein
VYFYKGIDFIGTTLGVAINENYLPGDGTVPVLYKPYVLDEMQEDVFRDSNLGQLSMLFASPPPPELQDPPQESGSQHS